MKKFPHINQFNGIVKRVNYFCDKYGKELPVLSFEGRVKLHGTNVSIRRFKQNITVQSRNRELTVKYDNYGFANFISSIPQEDLNKLFNLFGSEDDDITIYGEYIGKGIQGKVAVSNLPDKQWVIFFANVNDEYISDVRSATCEGYNIYNITQVPSYFIDIDFNAPEGATETLTSLTQAVENQCPWGKKFDVDGIGEGIVWFWQKAPEDCTMWFKTKGQKHSENKKPKKIVQLSPEQLSSISEFIDLTVTEDRLKQAYDYVVNNNNNELISIKHLGVFLKWVSSDILREEVDLLQHNQLEWKIVNKDVTIKAKQWFLNRIN